MNCSYPQLTNHLTENCLFVAYCRSLHDSNAKINTHTTNEVITTPLCTIPCTNIYLTIYIIPIYTDNHVWWESERLNVLAAQRISISVDAWTHQITSVRSATLHALVSLLTNLNTSHIITNFMLMISVIVIIMCGFSSICTDTVCSVPPALLRRVHVWHGMCVWVCARATVRTRSTQRLNAVM